jgi:hypothetical protein
LAYKKTDDLTARVLNPASDIGTCVKAFSAVFEAVIERARSYEALNVSSGGLQFRVKSSDPNLLSILTHALAQTDGASKDHTTIIFEYDLPPEIWALHPVHFPLSLEFRGALSNHHGLFVATIASPATLQIYDAKRNCGIQFACENGKLPPWELGSPLKSFIYWASWQKKLFPWHSGTLFDGEKGAIFAGVGGSGKSGTILAGMRAGLQSCGDDHVSLAIGSSFTARNLYKILKQDEAGYLRCCLPAAKEIKTRNWQNKIEVEPSKIGLAAFIPTHQVNAIVLPLINPSVELSSFRKVSFENIEPGLVRRSYNDGPGSTTHSIFSTLRLYRTLPIFRLSLGQNVNSIVDNVQNILRQSA